MHSSSQTEGHFTILSPWRVQSSRASHALSFSTTWCPTYAITLFHESRDCEFRAVFHVKCPWLTGEISIVRIAILPAVYGLFSVFSIAFYGLSLFLGPVSRIFEAVGICALFELYVVYITPSQPGHRGLFFQSLGRRGMFRRKHKHDKGSLQWFRVCYLYHSSDELLDLI
jgi:hypothetical protein